MTADVRRHLAPRLRSRWWLAGLVIGTGAAVVSFGIWLAWPSSGAITPDAAFAQYVRLVNTGDAARLADIVYPANQSSARAVLGSTPRPFVLSSVVVRQDFGPDRATAEVVGTSGGQLFHEFFTLRRSGGRWYVVVPGIPGSPVGPSAGPSAGTAGGPSS
jgi:hypothetical protein